MSSESTKSRRIVRQGERVKNMVRQNTERHYSNFTGAVLEDCKFLSVNLGYSTFDDAKISNTSFEESRMHRSSWVRAHVQNADMSNISYENSISCEDAVFDHVKFEHSYLRKSYAARAQFLHSNLDNSYWNDANLRDAIIDSCVAKNSGFDGADLTGAKILHTDMFGADFDYADLSNAHFDSTNLSNATFKDARIVLTKMHGAIMKNANFAGAWMDGADLTKADLTRANLASTSLRDANLAGADLTAAKLAGANLARAKLDGATLHTASYNRDTVWPAGYVIPQTAFSSDDYQASRAKAEEVFARNGFWADGSRRSSHGVFVDAPALDDLWDIVYCFYPDFFTVIDRWAYPERLAVSIHDAIELGMTCIRAGDGVKPYDTELDKATCLAEHFYLALTSAQIAAMAEIYQSRDGIRLGKAFNDKSHVVALYKRLNQQVTSARAANARAAMKLRKNQSLGDALASADADSTAPADIATESSPKLLPANAGYYTSPEAE